MSAKEAITSPPMSARSATFRSATHLIPTPGVHQPRPEKYEPPQVRASLVSPAALIMVVLGIGLEIGLHFSNKNQGFGVPAKNVFSFASTNFIASFIPTLLVAPLALLWAASDFEIRRYQPYVSLSHGNVTAQESILLDYVSKNKISVLWHSFRMRHWLLLLSTVATFISLLLQPLAGSIFEIQQIAEPSPTTTNIMGEIGLNPNIPTLSNFVSSAGYVQAAVANGLSDPPFVLGTYATAQFTTPESPGVVGNVTVNTVGVNTNVNCSAPTSLNLSVLFSNNYTISAQSSYQCPNVSHSFDPTSATQQYGVIPVPNCADTTTNQTFGPVFFWFFHFLPDEQSGTTIAQPSGVFCHPTISLDDVQANMNLNTNDLINVDVLGPMSGSDQNNNVSGSPLSGGAYNGVIFDFAVAVTDPFVQARSTSTASGVSAAILSAGLASGTSVFDGLDGFVNTTTHIYTMYLSLVAKSIYFVPVSQSTNSTTTYTKPRLVIDEFPAQFLSVVMIIIGVMSLFIQFAHQRARRHVWLADSPGSIGSAVSLTSHSGFGELLVPYDTLKTAEEKLREFRFRLDERTGAIVAYDMEGVGVGVGDMSNSGMSASGDGADESLLKSMTPPITGRELVFEPFSIDAINGGIISRPDRNSGMDITGESTKM